MNYIRVVEYLVPDVEWQDGISTSDLQSIKDHYHSPSGQPFPTNQEGIDAWAVLQAQDAAEEAIADEMADLEKAETYLTNQITPMSSLSVADRTRLRDILLRMFKYLRYGK